MGLEYVKSKKHFFSKVYKKYLGLSKEAIAFENGYKC